MGEGDHMKVGDLVKIIYNDTVTVITGVEVVPFSNDVWYHLLGENVTYRVQKLEVISESR